MGKMEPISPNSDIDDAISMLMKRIKKPVSGEPPIDPEVAVKILNTAIAWEKAKHSIIDQGSGFDPDSL